MSVRTRRRTPANEKATLRRQIETSEHQERPRKRNKSAGKGKRKNWQTEKYNLQHMDIEDLRQYIEDTDLEE